MGWASAGEIIDPQIPIMVNAVENEELEKSVAVLVLRNLIKKLQDNDWDTEDETLEQWTHMPWVVTAFAECGVTHPIQTVDDVKRLVRQTIDANVNSFYDLSDDFVRNLYATKIAEALQPLLKE